MKCPGGLQARSSRVPGSGAPSLMGSLFGRLGFVERESMDGVRVVMRYIYSGGGIGALGNVRGLHVDEEEAEGAWVPGLDLQEQV